MREIKFRAWDKTNKRMEEIDGGNLYVADNKVYEISEESHYYEVYMSKKDVTERYILTQFTGLYDKNGAPIYEGDIIIWGDKGAREKGTALHVTVEFKSGCFGIFDGKRFHEFYHYCADKWDDSEIAYDMWGELPIEKYFRACFEVIGNIYENKELTP